MTNYYRDEYHPADPDSERSTARAWPVALLALAIVLVAWAGIAASQQDQADRTRLPELVTCIRSDPNNGKEERWYALDWCQTRNELPRSFCLHPASKHDQFCYDIVLLDRVKAATPPLPEPSLPLGFR